ncbi:tRNA (adenosine(37)-N6)-dimethylallyltransferase MiaA [Lentibacillus sediminis]|uniref:tRNA (adenosine(37)-N6)-dimethylallyltransferase MiaA n=1 Tax=Lentibacillus sediminis TaxID=1940529 RepID=UPI000C1BCFCE|nr:tRNA (adenosine(37)-N6)-dimethylallyltransferase MiaA [Lentibacillus sediminis]
MKTVIVIVGPTAVGKSRLSVEIAKRFNGEVISGDSMQVYRGMDIGTAKISSQEMQGIPHYMVDIRDPNQPFSAADFQSYVQYYIKDISSRGSIPVIAGGSGLYIQAALFDYHFSDQERDVQVTERMEKQMEEEGSMPLYKRLQEIDPAQAKKIHPNNRRRVVRALEIYETTGMTMTEWQKEQQLTSPYRLLFIGLEMSRELLYRRINERVDIMLEKGLLDEVRGLYEKGLEGCGSMQAIGYKEFIPYFKGEQSLERSVELLKRNSRRYAKRQYTWFKNKLDIPWYEVTPDSINERFATIFNDLAGILEET